MRSEVCKRILEKTPQETKDWVNDYGYNQWLNYKIINRETFRGVLIYLYNLIK